MHIRMYSIYCHALVIFTELGLRVHYTYVVLAVFMFVMGVNTVTPILLLLRTKYGISYQYRSISVLFYRSLEYQLNPVSMHL